jgi:hypothetical protein
MTERYCPNCGNKLDAFIAQYEHDIVCRWQYAVGRGKLMMELAKNARQIEFTEIPTPVRVGTTLRTLNGLLFLVGDEHTAESLNKLTGGSV